MGKKRKECFCSKAKVHVIFNSGTIYSIVSVLLPVALIYYFMRGMAGKGASGGGGGPGGIFGIAQSKARIIKENTGVTFK